MEWWCSGGAVEWWKGADTLCVLGAEGSGGLLTESEGGDDERRSIDILSPSSNQ